MREMARATDGVCEKCLWDVDGNNYAGVTRPNDYDAEGPKLHYPSWERENPEDWGQAT